MRGICPNCEKERDLELIQSEEEIKVRGEPISVPVTYFRCLTCGDEFEDPGSNDDPLDKAYKDYRRRHGMLQPDEIRGLRKRYGLTQHELARLLGWGLVTLSRYENGALQDEAHDKTLRLAMEPENLIKLLQGTPDVISEARRKDLIANLKASDETADSHEKFCEERFGNYEPNIFSGYQRLDLLKLSNVILFFCAGGLLKTVLNKVLFYSDFKHFRDHSLSITGARYARIPFGPAPDKWQHFVIMMVEDGALSTEEIFYDENVSGERLTSTRKPDLNVFSNSELLILTSVKEHFKGWTAKKISDFSHQERGYIETPNGHLIPYSYSEYLRL